ncbi:hypothetical protein [Alkalimarinus alittae]|uniref:Uncharacterized protein n=1 Tax=Alkalimarinus alittae TaxID=2961619 RepID=A0ABY6MXP4_9ALTE|nr:hypothetical protein [Alkalimarinus alittae]UZE94598.1 hypothetical protein NKI27_10915 [Alkalimarinus alittae]
MNWSIENLSDKQVLHSTICEKTTEEGVKLSALAVADYALAMLGDSIEDDAMYCLFDWDEADAKLRILVTDHRKENDGKNVVDVQFTGLEQADFDDKTETLKFWLRDHLTTSADYLRYSLVAGFTRNGRETVELM